MWLAASPAAGLGRLGQPDKRGKPKQRAAATHRSGRPRPAQTAHRSPFGSQGDQRAGTGCSGASAATSARTAACLPPSTSRRARLLAQPLCTWHHPHLPQLELEQVAGAYANALVEVAQKTNSLEAVHADVDTLASVLKDNAVRHLAFFFRSLFWLQRH